MPPVLHQTRDPLFQSSRVTETSSLVPSRVFLSVSSWIHFLCSRLVMKYVYTAFSMQSMHLTRLPFKSNMFNNKYRSFPSALGSILRSGPSELFKGFVPSAIRDAPYAGIFVAAYESIKRRSCKLSYCRRSILSWRTSAEAKITSSSSAPTFLSSAGIHTFSAASAGAIATLVTHPFDVIKVFYVH